MSDAHPDKLGHDLEFLKGEVKEHGEVLRDHERQIGELHGHYIELHAEVGLLRADIGNVKTDVGGVKGAVESFRDEWREGRMFWRNVFKLFVERMTPWPLVVIIGLGMLVLGGRDFSTGIPKWFDLSVGTAEERAIEAAGENAIDAAAAEAPPPPAPTAFEPAPAP